MARSVSSLSLPNRLGTHSQRGAFSVKLYFLIRSQMYGSMYSLRSWPRALRLHSQVRVC